MSNKINVALQISLTGAYSDSFNPGTLSFSQAATGGTSGVLSVTTSAADIPYGPLSSPGYCVLQSLDTSTNTINWGLDASGTIEAVGQLAVPGDIALFRIKPGTSVRVQGSASTQLRYWILAN